MFSISSAFLLFPDETMTTISVPVAILITRCYYGISVLGYDMKHNPSASSIAKTVSSPVRSRVAPLLRLITVLEHYYVLLPSVKHLHAM